MTVISNNGWYDAISDAFSPDTNISYVVRTHDINKIPLDDLFLLAAHRKEDMIVR